MTFSTKDNENQIKPSKKIENFNKIVTKDLISSKELIKTSNYLIIQEKKDKFDEEMTKTINPSMLFSHFLIKKKIGDLKNKITNLNKSLSLYKEMNNEKYISDEEEEKIQKDIDLNTSNNDVFTYQSPAPKPRNNNEFIYNTPKKEKSQMTFDEWSPFNSYINSNPSNNYISNTNTSINSYILNNNFHYIKDYLVNQEKNLLEKEVFIE